MACGLVGLQLTHNAPAECCTMQVVVFDKLDYCGSLKNLDSVRDKPNFKVLPVDVLARSVIMMPCP